MIHADVSEIMKKWFILQPQYKGWFLFPNPSGFASKEKVRYGMPTAGGGSDWFAMGNGQTEFIEVKTDEYKYLSKKQKIFARNMTCQGFKCWVFRQKGECFYLIPATEYKASMLPEEYILPDI